MMVHDHDNQPIKSNDRIFTLKSRKGNYYSLRK